MKEVRTTPVKSNMQNRDNGIVTYTVENTWITYMPCGWGNGYVGLPDGHKHYGANYDDVPVQVHGGLTFGQEEEIDGVKYWVLGFDTAHWQDTLESCPESYVIAETESLYNQLNPIS